MDKFYTEFGAILLILVFLLWGIAEIGSNIHNLKTQRYWALQNHCDALCYGKYGINGNITVYFKDGWGYDYVCVCSDKGTIKARKTYL